MRTACTIWVLPWRAGNGMLNRSRAFDRSLELNPQNALAHHYRGIALIQTEQLDEAVRAFKKALESDASNAFSYYYLGTGPSPVETIRGSDQFPRQNDLAGSRYRGCLSCTRVSPLPP